MRWNVVLVCRPVDRLRSARLMSWLLPAIASRMEKARSSDCTLRAGGASSGRRALPAGFARELPFICAVLLCVVVSMIAPILAVGSSSHNDEPAPAAPVAYRTERVEWPLHAEYGRKHGQEPAKDVYSILCGVALDRLAVRSARACGRCT